MAINASNLPLTVSPLNSATPNSVMIVSTSWLGTVTPAPGASVGTIVEMLPFLPLIAAQ